MITSQFKFHHLGVAVADMAKSIPVYKTLFDYELTSGPFDDPIQKVSVCFLSRGDGDMPIELVAPLGPGSPVAATLAKGGSAYHVCYEVADINGALQHLRANRCVILAQPVPAVAFDMRKIAWLLTPTQQLIELVEAA